LPEAFRACDHGVGDRRRLDRRHAGVEAHDLDVVDGRQPPAQVAQAARRQHQRVAAGDDHLPDLRVGGDVGEGGVQLFRRQVGQPLGPDHLAAEAEPAIDRAGVGGFQQHAVGIAVDDPLDRAVGLVADRIAGLAGAFQQLGLAGHELAGDRVGFVGRIDQRRHVRGDRHGVARRHGLEGRQPLGSDQAGFGQGRGAAEGAGGGHEARDMAD
jgi:hypothetical protein